MFHVLYMGLKKANEGMVVYVFLYVKILVKEFTFLKLLNQYQVHILFCQQLTMSTF